MEVPGYMLHGLPDIIIGVVIITIKYQYYYYYYGMVAPWRPRVILLFSF